MLFAAGVPGLLLLGAAYSAVDAAVVELGEVPARAAREEGGDLARAAARLLDHEPAIRARLLAGRVVCICSAAMLAARGMAGEGTLPLWLALLGVVLLYGALVEVLSTFTRKYALRLALPLLRWFRPFELFMVPVALPLAWVGALAERLIPAPRQQSAADAEKMADLEVENVIDQAEESGAIRRAHADLLRGVLEFKDTIAAEIMVPRTQVVAIEQDMPFASVLDLVKDAGHSRYPVYRGRPDQIVGMLYAKDLFRVEREGTTKASGSIAALVRSQAFFVAETQKIGDLLRQMQVKRIHLAVVVDEYGGTAGIVTLEDILEEIVGDIHDEHDNDEPRISEIAPGRWLVDASLSVDDLREALKVELPEGEGAYRSVGGMVIEVAGRVPGENETVRVGDLDVIVRDADRRRVRHVEVVRHEREESDGADASADAAD
jgi:CBS domain containing-hemolysin-like protein